MTTLVPPKSWHRRIDDVALGAFVLVVVLAVPLLLYLGRDQWFVFDEWWVLAVDDRGLLDPHNGHWITVPAILYRVNYWLWGLHTYLPYQVPVVLLHVGSAVLLRVLMRRLGVRGWIATAAALVFVFFGTGSISIFFGFQVSMTGALFFGLAFLLLADRDGPIDRRDGLVLAVGAVGLMTSGVFVAMVAGVGVAVLLRRGPRVAAFYTLPLGFVYIAWYLGFGRGSSPLSLSAPIEAVRFCLRMLRGTFTALAQSDLGGLALALFVLAAVVATVPGALRSRRWAPLALTAGLVAAWVVFAALTAMARAGVALPTHGRFLYVTAALFLPLIALGAEHLARWNVLAGALPILVLAAGVPANVDELSDRHPLLLGNREAIISLAHSEQIDAVAPDRSLWARFRAPITTGWLAREAKAGSIPKPTNEEPTRRLENYGLVALHQRDLGTEQECPPASDQPLEVVLAVGEEIVFQGAISVNVRDGPVRSRPITFIDTFGSSIVADLGPLDLVVSGRDGARPRLCEPTAR